MGLPSPSSTSYNRPGTRRNIGGSCDALAFSNLAVDPNGEGVGAQEIGRSATIKTSLALVFQGVDFVGDVMEEFGV